MRVAMVSEHASPLAALGGVDAGGQNVHVAALAGTIADRGADVVVHTRRDRPDLPEWMELRPGVTVHHVDAGPPVVIGKDELWPYMDDFAAHISECWSERPPDVVHAHFWMSGYAAQVAARPLRIPVVQTFHALGVVKRRYQGDADTSPPERQEVEREILQQADRVIATCTDEVFELVRMGRASSQLTVIPCGVDLGLFGPDGPREPRRPGTHRLVCLGRLVERKGVGNVITALAELPDTELVIAGGPAPDRVGEDPEAHRLLSLAEHHGVRGRVELRGSISREALPALLRSADALVTVPWYEPFGITPLEAMACGLPVVASAVGGLIDTVVDGRTGVHVPPRDPRRLAAELRPLLDDGQRLSALGRAGVSRTRRLYSWKRIAGATLDVYARAAEDRPRRPRRVGHYVLPPDPIDHLRDLRSGLDRLERQAQQVGELGERLAARLLGGGRLLAVGQGASAALAELLTGELVGRPASDRAPLSALCLTADASSLAGPRGEAGHGAQGVLARQVAAHGREGDVLIVLSADGAGDDVLAAARAARAAGIQVWALTGRSPCPLLELADEQIVLPAGSPATGRELQLVVLHALCAAVEREVALRSASPGRRLRAGGGERAVSGAR